MQIQTPSQSRPHRAVKPKILMVFAPKGGVGKTMIASNILVAAKRSGIDAAGLDFDGQQAFATWGQDRLDHPITAWCSLQVYAAQLDGWRSAVQSLQSKELIVIDTPPGVEKANQTALEELGDQADIILMPSEVYGGSLRYVVDFVSWWSVRPGRALFVLNKTIAGRSMTRDARQLLSEKGEVWEDSIPLRDDIARAFDSGISASDDEAIPGHVQFMNLWVVCANRMKVST